MRRVDLKVGINLLLPVAGMNPTKLSQEGRSFYRKGGIGLLEFYCILKMCKKMI